VTTIEQPADVVTFLKSQHKEIESLMQRVSTSHGQERQDAWDELRRLLAVHETAEEEIVHPRARRALEDGEQVVEARLAEEHKGKQAIAELEKLDVDSTDFDTKFAQLVQEVKAHAEAEEHTEFERIAQVLDDEQLQGMRRAVQLAERMAPTHPHAGVESATANMLAGPFAAMMDRARDLLSGHTGQN
jgi:hemerythrin superfamily protein